MSIHEIAYLLRYLFAALIVVYVWLQLRLAVSELRWDMRNRVLPVPGYFLLFQQGFDRPGHSKDDPVRILSLFHTTSLGRSRSSDIRIQRDSIGKRHAVIYLYDGVWFVRPVSKGQAVFLNGVRILPPTPLENQDILTFGDQEFIFVNEKKSSESAGLTFLPTEAAPQFPKVKRSKKMAWSWLAVNLFAVTGSLLMIFLTPPGLGSLRILLAASFLGFILLSNLYFGLLPIVLKGADRVLILGLTLLTMLGVLIQVRLALPPIIGELQEPAAALTSAVLNGLAPQGLSLLAGFVLLPAIAFLTARTRLLEPLGIICGFVTPFLLIATLALGSGGDTYGASLWIRLGGFSIQLTEFAKITYLIVLASFFKNRPSRRIQLIFAAWAAMILFLIMLLPDMGSAMILLPTTLLVFVVMTSEYGTALAILLSGTGFGALAIALFPHVQRRLVGWTSLWNEVNDFNRQIVYGLQAVARGGLLGRGLSNGNPGGIPLASSDMVYSIICEEMGLIAGLGIVLVFLVIWLRSARITVTAQDGFSSGLALAIGTLFFMEAVIVIGGVTGLIPLTGATLPLIARGGSSILAKMILGGMLIGLSARRTEVS